MRQLPRSTPALMALTLFALAACGKPTPPAEPSPPPTAMSTPPPAFDTPAAMPSPDATMPGSAAAPGVTGAMPEGAASAGSAALTVPIKLITDKGTGADAGTVELSESATGLVAKLDLKGLPPGERGFHVHQNPDCGPKLKDGKMMAGEAAGEHLDPAGTGKHAGPNGAGHAGDLPRITVAADGTVKTSITIDKLKLADAKGHSLMVHSGRDDYAAAPGGPRIACGVIN